MILTCLLEVYIFSLFSSNLLWRELPDLFGTSVISNTRESSWPPAWPASLFSVGVAVLAAQRTALAVFERLSCHLLLRISFVSLFFFLSYSTNQVKSNHVHDIIQCLQHLHIQYGLPDDWQCCTVMRCWSEIFEMSNWSLKVRSEKWFGALLVHKGVICALSRFWQFWSNISYFARLYSVSFLILELNGWVNLRIWNAFAQL